MSQEDKIVENLTERGAPDAPMPLFASKRERRLWLWTLAVMVAIYLTLGLARTLSDELRNRDLFAALWVLGLVLIGVTVLTLAVKAPPGAAEVGVWLGVAAAYLLVLTRMASEVERSHLIEYGLVAVLVYEALKERASNGRKVPVPALVAIVITALAGTFDESIQVFIPSRVFDPVDIGFNALAAVMAIGASLALTWAQRWSE